MLPINPKLLFSLMASLLLAACAAPTPEPIDIQRPTASPTLPPLPTPTPIPAAVPLTLIDPVRATRLTTPQAKAGAPCGVVDVLDFPVGAPEGDGYSARWIFGRYSDRYSGIHAGEDWIFLNGSSLGKPVQAIGHGQVTYAQPLGWGVDRGVVIVRHVFSDGRTVLSFYGHLDPPSVVLRVGACVMRGQLVGAIGQPSTRPHLHFEIRHQLPNLPGPGYWPTDPTLAGWESPSAYIWSDRMSTAPGVQWLRPFTTAQSINVGVLNNNVVIFDGAQLLALNIKDGQPAWTHSITSTPIHTLIETSTQSVYLSTRSGVMQSIDRTGALNWQIDFANSDLLGLLPLPGGGVIVQAARKLIGISSAGDQLWQIDQTAAIPLDSFMQADRLIFTTVGDRAATYSIDRAGRLIKLAEISGRLTVSHDRVFIYASTGIYRLADKLPLVDLVLPLDNDIFNRGQIITTEDGTLLITQRGLFDRRLIALDFKGSFKWDRSLADSGDSLPRLIKVGQRVYALTPGGDVLLIDPQTGIARRLFNGGSNLQLSGEAWLEAVGDQLIFDFRGGTLVAFDPSALAG